MPQQTPREARCRAERTAQLTQVRDRLNPHASPREALSHALLSTLLHWQAGGRDATTDDLFHAARERWPDDVDLAFASTTRCREEDGCDRRAALRHLVQADGENAYAWMTHMDEAIRKDDPVAFASALRRAARASHFDTRAGSVFLAIRPALDDAIPASCLGPAESDVLAQTLGRTPTGRDYADLEAMGMEAAVWMPAFGTISRCRSPMASPAWRSDCLALLEKIATGDTLLEQRVGLSALLGMQPTGPAGAAARERYRQLLWLSEKIGALPLPDDFIAGRFAEGEVATLRAHLAQKGEWPPADDWLPENPDQRALVTGLPAPSPR